MDPVLDLVQSLQSCYQSSLSSLSPHPRPYKHNAPSSLQLQNQRRSERLSRQKQKRQELLSTRRESQSLSPPDISELVEVWDEDEDEDKLEDEMDCSSGSWKSHRRRSRPYGNILMLSEWMVEVPEQLNEEWLLIVCPVGKRCSVVSGQGQTRCYARNGYEFMGRFASLLPGGNRCTRSASKHNAILDCIFSPAEKTFFVLDIILWNGVSFYGCQTDFRFFWLESREEELTSAAQFSALNKFIFRPLRHYSCSETGVREALTTADFHSGVDGYMFMHKECGYAAGVTPLVAWLKRDMIFDLILKDKPDMPID